jgi:Pentapeptide repeats (8 copies)
MATGDARKWGNNWSCEPPVRQSVGSFWWDRFGLDLRGADLRGVDLHELPLTRSICSLQRDTWKSASESQRRLAATRLEGANLRRARLDRARLASVRLDRADLYVTHLESADLRDAYLIGTDLRSAILDAGVNFRSAHLGDGKQISALIADLQLNGANLARIPWQEVTILGDEHLAGKTRDQNGKRKSREVRQEEMLGAVRANRQISTAVRAQGLNEQADRFAYRAQLCQKVILRRQGRLLRYFGSLLLDLISGYGYRPLRSLITYLMIILGFAVAYFALGDNVAPALSPIDAIVFSVSSFHGRGFAPGEMVTLHSPLTILAAIEAIIGLLIEITLIATFTQRFFAR